MNKIFLLLFFCSGLIIADEYEYLIYRQANFPQDRFWSAGTAENPVYSYFKDCGRYEKNHDGKYSKLSSETPIKEKQEIDKMKDRGLIKLLNTRKNVFIQFDRIGEYKAVIEVETLSDVPPDYYEVKISS